MSTETPKPSMIERAIGAISPSWALQRHKSRVVLALSGGYAGGGYRSNLSEWRPGAGDADADSIRDLRELRSRSRDLVRNSPIAGGAIETQVTHVVGTGLSLQSRVNAEFLGLTPEQASAWQRRTETLYSMWARSEFADVVGEQNFYELQDLAFRSRLENGDVFVVLASKRRDGWPFTLALQVIEADRCCNPDFKSDTDTLVAGIQKDAFGEPVACWFTDRHPGTAYLTTGKVNWKRYAMRSPSGRRNVLHLKRKLRAGQTRGIPELAPIVEALKQIDRYSKAEVDAAVNSAAFSIFSKMDPEAFQEVFDDDTRTAYVQDAMSWDGTPTTGRVVNLLPGEEIQSAAMNRPNPNFDPFVQAFLTQIGIGLNIPKEVLTKHFQSSYSAARAALMDAWRTFKIRREWVASKLCQPVFEEWLADAVAAGMIDAPGFFADPLVRAAYCGSVWTGDGPGAIDPMKEASAAEKRMQIGLTTLSEEITAHDGGDWEAKHAQQVVEQKAREEGGLVQPVLQPEPANPQDDDPPEDRAAVAAAVASEVAASAVLGEVVSFLRS